MFPFLGKAGFVNIESAVRVPTKMPINIPGNLIIDCLRTPSGLREKILQILVLRFMNSLFNPFHILFVCLKQPFDIKTGLVTETFYM